MRSARLPSRRCVLGFYSMLLAFKSVRQDDAAVIPLEMKPSQFKRVNFGFFIGRLPMLTLSPLARVISSRQTEFC